MLFATLSRQLLVLSGIGAVAAAPKAWNSFLPKWKRGPIKPKVLIIDMFIFEAEAWYGIPEFDILAQNITVPGLSPLFPNVHCTTDGEVCQAITGEGEINAAATIASLVASPLFDLTSTYLFIAGIAGVNPDVSTIGSVAFARFTVQVGLQYEIDAREIPSNFSTGYFAMGAFAPDQYPQIIYGTEVFEFNDSLRKMAVAFASTAKLNDSDASVAYRANYLQTAAKASPSIVECDVATSDQFFSGKLIGDAFFNTTKLFTNGTGVYCATVQEDSATAEALLRAAMHKQVDFGRIILMRTFSDFDRPYPGQSVIQNLLYSNPGSFETSIENIYLAGVKVVLGIVNGWDSTFERGVVPTNYVGDIFGSLGGTPDFGPGKTAEPTALKKRNSRFQPAALGYGTEKRADGFIQLFANEQAQTRRTKKQLGADDHATFRYNADRVLSLTPHLAESTKLNISYLLGKWKTYCQTMNVGHWESVLSSASKGTAMDFLLHLCETCDITSSGTCWQYFRQWKQLYAKSTGRRMDINESDEVLKFHQTYLIPRFHLSAPSLRDKSVTDSGDLLALLSFNWGYDHRRLPSERQRLDIAACYLILASTGCRPAEIVDGEKSKPLDGSFDELFGPHAKLALKPSLGAELTGEELTQLLEFETQSRGRPKALCYEDMQLMVVRHPETGLDTLVLSIKFTHHKGADKKPKPTIFYFTPTNKLIFCLVTLIVSIAILDGAFDSPTLTSVEAIFRASVSGPVSYTPFRWKKEWLKRPVFRRTKGDLDAPLSYGALHDYMARQSLDTGYEKPIGPKDWRRNVANAVDGHASDAVRNQVMRHNSRHVFEEAYRNAHVLYDVQKAVLGEALESAMLDMLAHVGHRRDPRASSDMVPDEVWDLLPPDPEIQELEQRRAALKGTGYRVKGSQHEKEIQRISTKLSAKKVRRKKMVKQRYRLYYFHNRPTWDLERQANGQAPVDDGKPARNLKLGPRAVLATLLCDQPDDLSPDELHRRRIEAGIAFVSLGRLKEGSRPEIEGFLDTLGVGASPAESEASISSSDDGSSCSRIPSPTLSYSSFVTLNSSSSSFDGSPLLSSGPSPGFAAYESPYAPNPFPQLADYHHPSLDQGVHLSVGQPADAFASQPSSEFLDASLASDVTTAGYPALNPACHDGSVPPSFAWEDLTYANYGVDANAPYVGTDAHTCSLPLSQQHFYTESYDVDSYMYEAQDWTTMNAFVG
ncbi:hypothetical protein FRB96_008621 [Tulasnella sp. 330]|nr:hypothetical protein FRB96_008621 [Tulasnella sp. 330]